MRGRAGYTTVTRRELTLALPCSKVEGQTWRWVLAVAVRVVVMRVVSVAVAVRVV